MYLRESLENWAIRIKSHEVTNGIRIWQKEQTNFRSSKTTEGNYQKDLCKKIHYGVVNRKYINGTGLHGPDFSDRTRPAWLQSQPEQARSTEKNFGPGPAWPERKIEISVWTRFGPSPTRPETKYKILARARPGQFFFRFRTGPLGFKWF